MLASPAEHIIFRAPPAECVESADCQNACTLIKNHSQKAMAATDELFKRETHGLSTARHAGDGIRRWYGANAPAVAKCTTSRAATKACEACISSFLYMTFKHHPRTFVALQGVTARHHVSRCCDPPRRRRHERGMMRRQDATLAAHNGLPRTSPCIPAIPRGNRHSRAAGTDAGCAQASTHLKRAGVSTRVADSACDVIGVSRASG